MRFLSADPLSVLEGSDLPSDNFVIACQQHICSMNIMDLLTFTNAHFGFCHSM